MGFSSLRRHNVFGRPKDNLSQLPAHISDVDLLRSAGFRSAEELYTLTADELVARARAAGVSIEGETALRLRAAISNHRLNIKYGGGSNAR